MSSGNAIAGNVVSEKKRSFLPSSIDFGKWEDLEPLYKDLSERNINDASGLKKWLTDMSELDSAVSEHLGWLYIRMTCDTQDKKLSDAYTYFIEEINPKIEP